MTTSGSSALNPVQSAFAAAVAANIRAETARLGWRQSDLAKAMGWKLATVNVRWWGQRDWQLEDIEEAARALGTIPSALCQYTAWDSNPEPTDSGSAEVDATVTFLPTRLTLVESTV